MIASIQTAPFRLAHDSRATGEPWRWLRGTHSEESHHLRDWDPSEDLVFLRTLRLDAAGLREDTGLPPGCALRLGVLWRSTSALARGAGTVITVEGDEVREELSVEVAGRLLTGGIELVTVVTLAEAGPSRPITAWRAGSILWRDEQTINLDGGSRFPIQIITFRGWSWPAGALWRLEWDRSDLHAPVSCSVCVYLNAEHPLHAMLLGRADDPVARSVRAAMYHDVARSLIRGALEDDEFVVGEVKYPPRSVGRIVQRMLHTGFKGFGPLRLREEMRQTPDVFEARLQDSLKLFRELT